MGRRTVGGKVSCRVCPQPRERTHGDVFNAHTSLSTHKTTHHTSPHTPQHTPHTPRHHTVTCTNTQHTHQHARTHTTLTDPRQDTQTPVNTHRHLTITNERKTQTSTNNAYSKITKIFPDEKSLFPLGNSVHMIRVFIPFGNSFSSQFRSHVMLTMRTTVTRPYSEGC